MKRAKKEATNTTYTISDLSAQFEISPRSIRFYEEKGLLSPRRSSGNQRIYTKRDRARVKLILRGKRFGYSLDDIAEMIGMTDVNMTEAEQIEKSLAYGEKKLAEIRERVKELQLLEKDLLSIKERLLGSLAEIKN
jgi:DNA-binding transcriptional MerR regulator